MEYCWSSAKSLAHGDDRGAVLVESAIFFSFFVLLFFTVFDFAQGMYELNVVTEAARHGARSLASRTTIDTNFNGGKVCPNDIDPNWQNTPISFGPVLCNSLNPQGDGAIDILSNTALGSACSYLTSAGYNQAQFTVEGGLSLNYFRTQASNWKSGDSPPNPGGGAVGDTLAFLTVTMRRTAGSSCTICRLTGLAQPSASVTMPLNPWQKDKTATGFSRACN